MGLIGIEPHGLGQFRGGIVDASLTEEHHTEARVPVGAVGLEPERRVIRRLRLAQASLSDQEQRQGAVDVGIIRVESHGLGQRDHGLVVPTGVDQGLGQGTPRADQGWIEFQGGMELIDGLIEPVTVIDRDSQVVVGVRRGRVRPDRLGEARGGVGPGRLRTAPDPALTPAQGQQEQDQDQSHTGDTGIQASGTRPGPQLGDPRGHQHEAAHRREIAVSVRDEHRAHPHDARVGRK